MKIPGILLILIFTVGTIQMCTDDIETPDPICLRTGDFATEINVSSAQYFTGDTVEYNISFDVISLDTIGQVVLDVNTSDNLFQLIEIESTSGQYGMDSGEWTLIDLDQGDSELLTLRYLINDIILPVTQHEANVHIIESSIADVDLSSNHDFINIFISHN